MKRYQFIREHHDVYPIDLLTGALTVSRSGYYGWRDRPVCDRLLRHELLAEQVHSTHQEHHGIYGSRKIAETLIDRKVQVCRNTVAKLMREMNLKSRAQRRRSFTLTTDSNHSDPIARNRLQREFTAAAPNEKWVADITFVATDQGWAYLAAVMDLFSRRIVGWSVSDSLETSLVLKALDQAIKTRRPTSGAGANPGAGLLHHSDRGCQYASRAHRSVLAAHGIECSMSRRGNCWDNAPMERFMNSYKNEWVHHQRYETVEDVHRSAFEYIEIFYNRERRHQALGYLSPAAFEAQNQHSNVA